jgi:hypothetical protein
MALLLGMQPTPGLHGDRAVLVVAGGKGGGRRGPGGGVGAVELGAMAAWPAGGVGRPGWRVGVEAAVGPESDQDCDGYFGQVEGELGGVVAGIEGEQRDGPVGGQALQERADLAGGLPVSVVGGVQPGRSTGRPNRR